MEHQGAKRDNFVFIDLFCIGWPYFLHLNDVHNAESF